MYEFTLTNSVNDAVQRLCREAGWKKINRVLIRVGAMREINPELMSFIFAALSKDTPAEGAILSVMLLPITVKCNSCGKITVRDDSNTACRICGSKDVKILSGQELNIEALEVESNLEND